MYNEEMEEQAQFEELIQGLIDHNYGCCNDFLLPNVVTGLRNNIQTLDDLGKLKPSGIGNKSNFKKNKKIRGDKINWIENQSINEFEAMYSKKIQHFISYLNKTCYTTIKNFESHYASYEKNSFYKRHIDQFKSEKGRQFSLVLYLNENWKEEDGGNITLYPKDLEQINISPLGGRLVLFRSDEMEHEVKPSLTRQRNSIACWLKN